MMTTLSAWPAAAHPLGLPAFAAIEALGTHTVEIRWIAAPDDAAELAAALGLAVIEPGALLTPDQDREVSRSPVLLSAVSARVQVLQDGMRCPADVAIDSLATRGFTLRAICDRPVSTIEVTLRLLSDVDPRYRTLAVAGVVGGPRRVLFSEADPVRTLHLDPSVSLTETRPPDYGPGGLSTATGGAAWERRFVALIDRSAGGLGLLIASWAFALLVGAVHGLAPGHGKAIAAAYLVADRARRRDALVLGGAVAGMHTGSSLVLGLALYTASRQPAIAALTSWLELIAGLIVTALGAALLIRRARPSGSHSHGHAHTEQAADRPLSTQRLVALGAAGGLLPSPSALLVLLTALATGRLAMGLSLIAMFSLGLAATVTTAGLAVIAGRDLLAGWMQHRTVALALRLAPMVAAAGVVVLGLVVVMRAGGRLI